ncbi:hypothetical protein Snoj_46420 [Streptomyces nojiriensis]|uniref:Uncharacterized protein n=1 Tax=Streptomyces nojiriensis TaxID=66374 RepID=A0ABQ3SRG6_9ACTN|nr:hypothetical protein GCM10010205_78730 [Streptomyces nojiriensis]GHI70724.1 hypothetical protein Snoj_46420 [Streptomyces nojiriensis]
MTVRQKLAPGPPFWHALTDRRDMPALPGGGFGGREPLGRYQGCVWGFPVSPIVSGSGRAFKDQDGPIRDAQPPFRWGISVRRGHRETRARVGASASNRYALLISQRPTTVLGWT